MALKTAAIAAVGISALATAATATPHVHTDTTLRELKNATESFEAASSIGLLNAFDPKIRTFCGIDLIGNDLWSERNHPNPDSCVAPCRPETGCDAAVWTKFEGGTCYFKRVQGSWANSKPLAGAAAFIRNDVDYQRYMGPDFPDNMDMPGNDLESRWGGSSSDCPKACATSPFCFAYTWTNFNGGTCWLKSKPSVPVYSPGAYSAYTGRITNPDTCLTFMG